MHFYFCPEFITDLKNHDDAAFARRALRKTIKDNGEFYKDKDDHRYNGIDDAWIRYISAGGTAYRMIYIQKGDRVYFYRAGNHDIEEHLAPPNLENAIEIAEAPLEEGLDAEVEAVNRFLANHTFSNSDPRLIFHEIMARRLIPHSDIYLIMPNVDTALISSKGSVGKIITNQAEDGARVYLVTTPPERKSLHVFEDLERKGVESFFCDDLNSRLYLFLVPEEEFHRSQGANKSIGIVGSAVISQEGFPTRINSGNEELCYEIPAEAHAGAEEYAVNMVTKASDLRKIRNEYRRH